MCKIDFAEVHSLHKVHLVCYAEPVPTVESGGQFVGRHSLVYHHIESKRKQIPETARLHLQGHAIFSADLKWVRTCA